MNDYADVNFAADRYRCYVGEPITLFARIEAKQDLANYRLTVSVPAGLNADSFRVTPSGESDVPQVFLIDDKSYIEWRVAQPLAASQSFEYEVRVTVAHLAEDTALEAHLIVSTQRGVDTLRTEQSLSIATQTKGSYLNYLPALYYDDELMGRFVMLFESFWKPIEGQIDTIHTIFDPQLTPAYLLPWLASWMDMLLDERWPEPAQRLLLSRVAPLYRKRGTRAGLAEYLEIFTGQTPHIVERRANSFKIGKTNLGQSVALGKENTPHSFSVTLRLPPVEGKDEIERERKERDRTRTIHSIIIAEKPAHTNYTLAIEPLQN